MNCRCVFCRFPTSPNDRLRVGVAVAHAACVMAAQLKQEVTRGR
jgi:hypothetical protein